MRRPDAAAGDDKVVFGAHAADTLDDLVFVVGDYFNAFEGDAEREAPAREVGGVGVDCLFGRNSLISGVGFAIAVIFRGRTFPPRTSSPMIRHAAVCIVLDLFSWNVADDVMLDRGCTEDVGAAADVWA